MLFNSLEFILIFLPICLFLFYFFNKLKLYNLRIPLLIAFSLYFYSWWSIKYLFLLIFSILINFFIGKKILKIKNKIILAIGISVNLLLLGYYKYANFFLENVNYFWDTNFHLKTIILPLGISFYTFQQITYLVDCYLDKIKNPNLDKYFLFVIFFPQIIAGPIVYHNHIVPQFNDLNKNFFSNKRFSIGITTFVIGLFKKTFLADNLALIASPFFYFSEMGRNLNFFEAWIGAISYTFQLYFDFSGYSDMALGIGLMFGIVLPVNFFSPFKSKNISEFWMCWHITLSKLVRNYVYYPISIFLSRKAIENNFSKIIFFLFSVMIPTLISFLLIGFWHGAGWNFILFGLINGFYIIIYNIWTMFTRNIIFLKKDFWLYEIFCKGITFVSFVIALVFFKSSNIEKSFFYLKALFGLGKFDIVDIFQVGQFSADPYTGLSWILFASVIIFFLPNTQEFIFKNIRSPFNKDNLIIKRNNFININWSPNIYWGVFFVIMFVIGVLFINKASEFLYFQF